MGTVKNTSSIQLELTQHKIKEYIKSQNIEHKNIRTNGKHKSQ